MTGEGLSIRDFLRARYDELAESANGADGAHVYFDAIDDEARNFYLERDIPKYVLDDLDSKRAILDEHRLASRRMSWNEETDICGTCRYDNGLDVYFYPCPTLRALAAPFAAHPDYHESWKP